jgi:acyl-CoA hydrolase
MTLPRHTTKSATTFRAEQADAFGNLSESHAMLAMSNAAFLCAGEYAQSDVIMAKADSLEFARPLPVGDLVRIETQIVFQGWASMTVVVEMTSGSEETAGMSASASGRFMMVAVDKSRLPIHIPGSEVA